jgi:hypothetical protein
MIRAVCVILILPSALCAETARIISGEHDDFTRLVVELPIAEDWRLGRTETGYEFVVNGPTQPSYDLTGVWDRIPRARLRALWADPETGSLRMTISCPCHAFPFELRAGVVVIDVRNGPAPKGSAFEMALDGSPVDVEIASDETTGALPRLATVTSYDWLAPGFAGRTTAAVAGRDLPLPTEGVSLNPLRDELLEQISRGAAEGVVDMTLPGKPPTVAAVDRDGLPWSRITIGEIPGVEARTDQSPDAELQPDGAACLPDDRLAISDWGTDEAASVQLANARSGLLGEFDVPDPKAVKQTMRAHLFLGFGAEAIQYGAFLDPDPTDQDLRLYTDMARIMDGMESPASVFAGMLSCDGAAALWAALLYARLPTGPEVNATAIARSFAALPPHLRRHLGAGLAQKLLDRGDGEEARMIRDAMARTPWIASADIDLLEARAGLSEGDLEVAETRADAALVGGADGLEAALTLVEAAFRKGTPVTPDLAETARSFLNETKGTGAEPAVRRALVLSLALSAQTDAAFDEVALAPTVVSDLWQVVSARATDDAFLQFAVVPAGSSPPSTTAEVATVVSSRLLSLGFPEAALIWLGPVDASATPERRLIAARAEQARGDARRALALVQGVGGIEAESLRAEALIQLGTLDAAITALNAAGENDDAQRVLVWQRDWTRLAVDGPEGWKTAAEFAVSDAPVETGLLAQGAALLEDSQSARLAVATLLAAVPADDPASR